MAIFERYDPTMLAAGCDEGYLKYVRSAIFSHVDIFIICMLSITKYCEQHMVDATTCVEEIRGTVFRETSLTVSAGIAPNRVRVHI